MNGEFLNEEAKHFAQRVAADTPDVKRQIHRAFEIAFCRPPAGDELTRMSKLVEASEVGLTSLCRVLLNASEFIYVD